MAYDVDLADRIRELITSEPGLSEKRMFGGLAFLLDGRLSVCAANQGGLLVRVDPDEQAALLERPGAEPFEMRGRPMTGWLRVRADAVSEDSELAFWVERGVSHAQALA